MSANRKLNKAKMYKNDEFYTRMVDIESELSHYKGHFRNKVVYCNCDDPRSSKFVEYFLRRFKSLRLKKLIASCYKPSLMYMFLKEPFERGVYFECDGSQNKHDYQHLKGDGDFRSRESIDLLTQADIVVSNPPFSLFREYVAQLVRYEKKFLIIGNMNAITYKDIFPLIRDGKLWIGHNQIRGMKFVKPDGTEQRMGYVAWFTNLEYEKLKEDMVLTKSYTPESYPKYDNYDAIEVSRTGNIPYDYDGAMGVPISFMDKYNPDQFKIIDRWNAPLVNGKMIYKRIIIRNKRL